MLMTTLRTTLISFALICGMAYGPCETTGNTRLSQDQKKARTTPPGVGEVAPDFRLEDQNGKTVTLSEARGKTTLVVVFYRGYW
jgi:cytochrome oxidase Cu insertion factor (SCO1/SenC/PrrC family)